MKEISIKLNKLLPMDTPEQIISKLSEGNPGAITVCCLILKESQRDLDKIKYLLMFDTLEVYGSRLYMFWNDCCNRDLNRVYEIIDLMVDEKITSEEIISHIDYDSDRGQPFDFNQLSLSRVKECRHMFMKGFCQKCGISQSRAEEYNERN